MDINNAVSFVGQSHQPVSTEPRVRNKADHSVAELANKNIEKQKIERAVADVNQFFLFEQRKLSFSVNELTHDIVIQVKDIETDQVLRQIPPDYVLKLAEHLAEVSSETDFSSGLLLSDKA